MTLEVDLDQYWGVRLRRIEYDCAAMSVAFDLYWTVESLSFSVRLLFDGVSRLDLVAEKIHKSEVVELVSIEGREEGGGCQIVGELSNYEFAISCVSVKEIKNPCAAN